MNKKVLIVDDSATVRQQVSAVLCRPEFELIEAADGVEGLEVIGRFPDLAAVICDVNMPHMDGLQMLEAVRKDQQRAQLPVIMLTTEGQHELIQRAKAAGAKGWIVKPFKSELLLAAIRRLTAQ